MNLPIPSSFELFLIEFTESFEKLSSKSDYTYQIQEQQRCIVMHARVFQMDVLRMMIELSQRHYIYYGIYSTGAKELFLHINVR